MVPCTGAEPGKWLQRWPCSTKDGRCFNFIFPAWMRLNENDLYDESRKIQHPYASTTYNYNSSSRLGFHWTPPTTSHETCVGSFLPTVCAGSQAWCVTPCGHDTCHNSAGPLGSFMEQGRGIMSQGVKHAQVSHIKPRNDEHKVDNPIPFNGEFSRNPRRRIQGLGQYNQPRYWHCACGHFAPLKLDDRTP